MNNDIRFNESIWIELLSQDYIISWDDISNFCEDCADYEDCSLKDTDPESCPYWKEYIQIISQKRNCIETKRKNKNMKFDWDKLEPKIIKMMREGYTRTEIAKELNAAVSTIHKKIMELIKTDKISEGEKCLWKSTQ